MCEAHSEVAGGRQASEFVATWCNRGRCEQSAEGGDEKTFVLAVMERPEAERIRGGDDVAESWKHRGDHQGDPGLWWGRVSQGTGVREWAGFGGWGCVCGWWASVWVSPPWWLLFSLLDSQCEGQTLPH